MDTTGPRRLLGVSRLASPGAPGPRRAGAAGADAVAPALASAPAGDPTARQPDPRENRRDGNRHSEHHRIVLQAVDLATGRVLWQMPMEAVPAFAGTQGNGGGAVAPHLPDTARALAETLDQSGDTPAAPAPGEAYAHDDTPLPGPAFSRKA